MNWVYVACPVDNGKSDLAQILWALQQNEFKAYVPQKAFSIGDSEPDPIIYNINTEALRQCDTVWAWLPKGVPTIGVCMEIQQAADMGKTVVIYTDIDNSWHLSGVDTYSNVHVTDDFDTSITLLQTTTHVNTDRLIRYKRLDVESSMPRRHYPGDAGFDLVTVGHHTLEPGRVTDVPVGISYAMPEGMWSLIIGRSSSASKGFHVIPAVIDNGWRGPMWVRAIPFGEYTVDIFPGERIGQIIPMNLLANNLQLHEVDELPPSSRDQKGMGSTG